MKCKIQTSTNPKIYLVFEYETISELVDGFNYRFGEEGFIKTMPEEVKNLALRELLQAFKEKYNEENIEEDVNIYDHHIDDFINSL